MAASPSPPPFRRMPEGDGAAVHVHALRIGAEHRSRIQDDGGEGLVQLDALDVVDRLAGLLERDLPRLGRGAREVGEVVGDVRLGDDRGQHLEPALAGELLARHDQSPGAVVHPRRIAGGRGAFGVEHGLQLRELLERRVAPGTLVDREVPDPDELVREEAVVDRPHGALVRAKRPAVLLLAGDPELAGDE